MQLFSLSPSTVWNKPQAFSGMRPLIKPRCYTPPIWCRDPNSTASVEVWRRRFARASFVSVKLFEELGYIALKLPELTVDPFSSVGSTVHRDCRRAGAGAV